MKNIRVPLAGPSGQARFAAQNARRLIDCFLESDEAGKEKVAVVNAYGAALWAPVAGVARGALVVGDYFYFVCGKDLYRADTSGTVSGSLGTLTTDSGNRVFMARNRTQILLTDGTQEMFVYDFLAGTFSSVNNFSAPIAIDTITRSSKTATVTTVDNHGATTGQKVLISGASYAPNTSDYYNGEFTLTKTGDKSFTFQVTGKAIATLTASNATGSWVATLTTATPHQIGDGDQHLHVVDCTPSGYNASDFTATKVDEYTLTYGLGGDPGGDATVLGVLLPPTPDSAPSGVPLAQVRGDGITFAPSQCVCMDGYFLANNTRESLNDGVHKDQIYISEPDDGTTWDATKVAAAQRDPDDLTAMWANGGDLYLLGQFSVEPWFDSGASDFPFEPSRAAATPWGILAPSSVADVGEGIAWIAQRKNGQVCVVMMEGYMPKEISNRAVAYRLSLASQSDLAAATAFSFRRDGHDFYVLTFGSETWCFDAAESRKLGLPAWAEWTMPGRYYGYFAGKHLVTSATDAEILELDASTYTTRVGGSDVPVVRSIVSGYLHIEDGPLTIGRVQLDMDNSGAPGTVLLETSGDNGATWTSIGEQPFGGGDRRVEWGGVGTFYTDALLRFSTSDPVPFVVVGCYATIEEGNAL